MTESPEERNALANASGDTRPAAERTVAHAPERHDWDTCIAVVGTLYGGARVIAHQVAPPLA